MGSSEVFQCVSPASPLLWLQHKHAAVPPFAFAFISLRDSSSHFHTLINFSCRPCSCMDHTRRAKLGKFNPQSFKDFQLCIYVWGKCLLKLFTLKNRFVSLIGVSGQSYSYQLYPLLLSMKSWRKAELQSNCALGRRIKQTRRHVWALKTLWCWGAWWPENMCKMCSFTDLLLLQLDGLGLKL